jgi:hypothetical protein
VREFAELPRKSTVFRPRMKVSEAAKLHSGWLAAVKRVL